MSLKVLCACEESQAVTKAFRALGHEAYSCDLQDCSGGHPEWHIKGDVIPLLDLSWDMIIAFPPCTYLSFAANRVWNAPGRDILRQQAAEFFMLFVNAPCDRIAIENPNGYMTQFFRSPDQIIHPYMFGDRFFKRTCLWLKGLPPLVPTNLLNTCDCDHYVYSESVKGPDRQILRSKTFPGVAAAMASQWSYPVWSQVTFFPGVFL